MCPFLNEENNLDEYDNYSPNNNDPKLSLENIEQSPSSYLLQDDKKFFIIGGVASVAAFAAVAYFMYSNSKPVDLDELPVIHANTTPLKVKPSQEDHVGHQDKIVYDNISGEKTAAVAVKTIPPPEEVLSINEIDSEVSLSDEEKKNIIKAFDDLVPEKEYKINYVKSESKKNPSQNAAPLKNNAQMSNTKHRTESNGLMIEENASEIQQSRSEIIPADVRNNASTKKNIGDYINNKNTTYDPPIRRIKENSDNKDSKKNKKSKLKNLVNELEENSAASNGIMVQIASLPSKIAAETEYKRLLPKNKVLRGLRKNVVRVDLGRNKGLRYRVLVGPFKNQAQANKIIHEMKQTGVNAYISR
ncbi:MAG: SPOR domain-containing protein [Holosporaceae bacterium]|jgi:cell division protein FtsN|nr:SPOR domain-containing protein [Holosporaceae bacterium]